MRAPKFKVGDKVTYYQSGNIARRIEKIRDNGISAGTDYGYSYKLKGHDIWQNELCLDLSH